MFENKRMLSAPESLIAGKKLSDFQISVELSLVLVNAMMLLKSVRG